VQNEISFEAEVFGKQFSSNKFFGLSTMTDIPLNKIISLRDCFMFQS
jgi:hypothetical protein